MRIRHRAPDISLAVLSSGLTVSEKTKKKLLQLIKDKLRSERQPPHFIKKNPKNETHATLFPIFLILFILVRSWAGSLVTEPGFTGFFVGGGVKSISTVYNPTSFIGSRYISKTF